MKLTTFLTAAILAATNATAEPDYAYKLAVGSALDGLNACAGSASKDELLSHLSTGMPAVTRANAKLQTLVSMGEANSEDKALNELLLEGLSDCFANAVYLKVMPMPPKDDTGFHDKVEAKVKALNN